MIGHQPLAEVVAGMASKHLLSLDQAGDWAGFTEFPSNDSGWADAESQDSSTLVPKIPETGKPDLPSRELRVRVAPGEDLQY